VTALGFDLLASRSRNFHGHKYVLPVAAWILDSGIEVISVSEAITGLGGRAERPRVIEALERLVGIDALVELPREDRPNAARMFQRAESPYWALVSAEAALSDDSASKRSGAGRGE
jgi:hypothetical protein